MVSWWWIPVAVWVGCFWGMLIISMCTINKELKEKIEKDNTSTIC
ncbi:hypothetical protein [Pelosinus sp. IPA-1]|nr:hypothetical protein [Pelosinus sp. IPA-1]GMA99553.1 hypothetical protein PIPA1_23530 [Pelosinus sp. IPA-1]